MTKLCLLQYNIHDPLMHFLDGGVTDNYDPNAGCWDMDGMLGKMFCTVFPAEQHFRNGNMDIIDGIVFSRLGIMSAGILVFNAWYPTMNLADRRVNYTGLKDSDAVRLKFNGAIRSYEETGIRPDDIVIPIDAYEYDEDDRRVSIGHDTVESWKEAIRNRQEDTR